MPLSSISRSRPITIAIPRTVVIFLVDYFLNRVNFLHVKAKSIIFISENDVHKIQHQACAILFYMYFYNLHVNLKVRNVTTIRIFYATIN